VPLPDNPLKEINSYFIQGPERSLLIDTGFRHPECKAALMCGLEELGADIACVDIFLTHVHADHTGLSSELAAEGSRTYISAIDGEIMKKLPLRSGEWDNEKWVWNKERETLLGMPAEIIENLDKLNPALKYAPLGGAEYTFLHEGDMLQAGGYNFRCVLTPGHSPGHMCLWDEDNGIIFTGDHVLFDITPNITAWHGIDDSLGDYLNSLAQVRELPVKIALPGHRKPGDFHVRIDELIGHHHKRLAEVEGIVREKPGLTAYEIAGEMRWKIRAADWNSFPPSQKIFAVGECQAHLNYLELRSVLKREKDNAVYRFYLA